MQQACASSFSLSLHSLARSLASYVWQKFRSQSFFATKAKAARPALSRQSLGINLK
jgi:hypothetical protein